MLGCPMRYTVPFTGTLPLKSPLQAARLGFRKMA